MFRSSPPGAGFCSATHSTWAPSRVSRRAMIRPMSPDPRTTTRRPTMRFLVFIRFWAVPAVYTPAGRVPGMAMAPRVRSRQPVASTTAPAWQRSSPRRVTAVTCRPAVRRVTMAPVTRAAPGGLGLPPGPAGVLRAGEGLPVPDEAEAVVDALVEDAPHLVLPLQHQDGGRPRLFGPLGGGQAPGAAPDDDHVVIPFFHHFTLPVNRGDPAPR